jgi:hypothetical protein
MSILLSILISLNVMASNDERALNLLNATNVKDLKMKIRSYSESKKLENKCAFELSSKLIPKSCYRLKLSAQKIEVIDQACERASIIMKEEVNLKGLSKNCSEFVDKKNKDIRYSNEEADPKKFVLE